MQNPKLIFYGGAGSTTGANIMLEIENHKILVDCGLFQGVKENEDKNFESFNYNPADIDVLLITHAHLDHIGRAPKLAREGFRGKIISTVETMELARPILEDALKVIRSKHPNKILFEQEDIEKVLLLWEGKNYGQKTELFQNCFLNIQNAGHILGSAILTIEMASPKKDSFQKVLGSPRFARPDLSQRTFLGDAKNFLTISFTGDLGNSPSPLLPDTEFPRSIDYLVVESVYGDRNHENKEERRKKLRKAILEGINKNGTIIMPVFSIEKTQILLYEINKMVEEKEIPQTPVFLDSPLAVKITEIYKKYKKDFKKEVSGEIKKGDDIFNFPGLKVVKTAEESQTIENIKGPKIILAGSGMSEGGRVINHEIYYLPDPNATIILVGYQSVGSLGRKLEDGVKEVFINKEKIKIRAKIEVVKGYSSHMDSEHLLGFVEKVNTPPNPPLDQGREGKKLKKVFVIMGEPKSSLFLTQRIRDYLDIDAVYPEEGKEYELK